MVVVGKKIIVVPAATTTLIEDPSLNLPRTKNNPKQHKNKHQEKAHANNDLTRFGLNAYVPGAIKREINYLEDDYNASSFSDLKRAPDFPAFAKP